MVHQVRLEQEDRRETVACVVRQVTPVTPVCLEREEKLVHREHQVWTESQAIRGQPDPQEQLVRREREAPGENPVHRDSVEIKDCRGHQELLEIMEILVFLDPLDFPAPLAPLEILYVCGVCNYISID